MSSPQPDSDSEGHEFNTSVASAGSDQGLPRTASSSSNQAVSPPTVAAASSIYLMDDPKLKDVMLSDLGPTALLTRLKQSIVSTRELATFVRKKAQLESEHHASMKKLVRHTRDALKRPDARQGTFARHLDELLRIDDKVGDVTSPYVASLHQMHDELQDMAKTIEKSRKTLKETALRNEKNVADAEAAVERAKSKYDTVCEELERVRTGDPSKRKIGFNKKGAQYEEDVTRKVQMADEDYKARVETARRMRRELVNSLRPVTVKELKDLILEMDSGVSLQLAKYAVLKETLALNTGFIVAPLRPAGSATTPLSMKDIVAKVDNELDLYNYLLAASGTKQLNRKEVQFEPHSSLVSAYPKAGAGTFSQSNTPTVGTGSFPSAGVSSASGPGLSGSVSSASSNTPPVLPASTAAPSSTPVAASATPVLPLQPVLSAATSLSPIMSETSTHPSQTFPPATAQTNGLAMPVYGVPLDELLDYEEATVPKIVYQCVQAIDSFGLDVEGIYRHPGSTAQTQEIKRLFDVDANAVDLLHPSEQLNDIHSVASALKLYFRELPDSLLTSEFHAEFMEAAQIENDSQRRDAVHATVNKLPDPNYTTLRYLTFHLHRVQEREAANHMSVSSLGSAWGASLMSSRDATAADMALMSQVVATILFNAYIIFDAE